MESLQRILHNRAECPHPPDWEKAFGNQPDIEVDLGCGRGHYAWERATKYPKINMIALEMRKKWIDALRNRAKEKNLKNFRAIRCDVNTDLPILFAKSSVTGFTIHHPDPWWKKRHKKRSMIQPKMVECIYNFLAPNGFVFMPTDVPDLADSMHSILNNHPGFSPADAQSIQENRMGAVRSHREIKCIEKGIPLYKLAYIRK